MSEKNGNGKRNTFLNYASMVILVAALAFLILIMVWLFYPYKIAHFTTFEVTNRQVKQGDSIHLSIVMDKYKSLPADYVYAIEDGALYNILSGRTFKAAGHYELDRNFVIPKDASPGTYHLVLVNTYHPNPLRQIDIKTTSNEFEVVK